MAAPPVPIRSRAHGSAESNVPSVVKQDHRGHQNAADEAQVQQVPVQHRPEDHDVGDDTNTEEAATLPMAGVTQTMDDLLWLDENEYKDVVKGAEEGSAIRSTRPDDSGRLLPKELIERRNTTTSGTPGFSGSNPSSSSGNSQQDLSASENYSISHDGQYALTQPYPDTGGKSQFEGSQDDPNDSVQETQSPQQVVASLEAPIENALETEPINVSSSQQDRICETQPTLSRQASAEPTSQEVSQDFFAVLSEQILHPQERVSATPVELIINTSSTRHVSSETQGFVSDDGDLRKLRKRMHELEGRVPQTQEEKGHIGVSNVSIASTVLAPGPTADSLEGSLDSHPGHTSGNNEDPAFRELAASNKKGGFLAESEDELDRGSDNAVEERSFVVRTATPLRDDNDCSTEEYSELEDDELLSRSHRRPSRPILKDSQELLDVSPQVDDTPILGTGMYSGANALETPQSGTRPSSQTSTRSKEGSPKHGIESDTEGSPPKPAKLMKTESVDDSTFPSPFTRTPSSRSLSRRASDLESVRSGIMLSASSYSDKKKIREYYFAMGR
ncbi:hypothetical protein BC939DRAFT_175718 [Gamsiella multidivaricata]|uniref:uncharacterized protein n=1 Tax=Gamsiella multidivaricata TaxID=101098 RepID=UPI00221F2CA1|nr:uncharacterized protein BC939DRAFT_175718 [Gamsiella multidivaricata]KAI7822652.1 hypothetical protein BC939DRAFT_175718 [Gamsiella multidivaricata]